MKSAEDYAKKRLICKFVISAKIVTSASPLEGCVVIYITKSEKNVKSAEGFDEKSLIL